VFCSHVPKSDETLPAKYQRRLGLRNTLQEVERRDSACPPDGSRFSLSERPKYVDAALMGERHAAEYDRTTKLLKGASAPATFGLC
jgi:hypothetical protein